MARLAATKIFCIGGWAATGCGVVACAFFFNYYPHSSSFFRNQARLWMFGCDILPYVIVAVAAMLGRTFLPAAFCMVASFWILSLSFRLHLDEMKRNFLNGWINDNSLFIVPQQWTIAMAPLVVATTCSLWMKFVAAP